MEKIKRNGRLGALTRILLAEPNRIHTLNEFCTMFGSAKSTLSEDIDLLASSFDRFDLGRIETVTGASGGVRYRPVMRRENMETELQAIAKRMCEPGRMLPGGFLYTSDITSNPSIAQTIGRIIASPYFDKAPDIVVTMETKGIPIALMTAHMLGVPLVIARKDSRAYEGTAVKINYATGVGEEVETMALEMRAVYPGQRALIVDDFMKGGGTLKGMVDMMNAFNVTVIGMCVLVATASPAEKSVKNVRTLLTLDGFNEKTGSGKVTVDDSAYSI